jgi:hypothetical protein
MNREGHRHSGAVALVANTGQFGAKKSQAYDEIQSLVLI